MTLFPLDQEGGVFFLFCPPLKRPAIKVQQPSSFLSPFLLLHAFDPNKKGRGGDTVHARTTTPRFSLQPLKREAALRGENHPSNSEIPTPFLCRFNRPALARTEMGFRFARKKTAGSYLCFVARLSAVINVVDHSHGKVLRFPLLITFQFFVSC